MKMISKSLKIDATIWNNNQITLFIKEMGPKLKTIWFNVMVTFMLANLTRFFLLIGLQICFNQNHLYFYNYRTISFQEKKLIRIYSKCKSKNNNYWDHRLMIKRWLRLQTGFGPIVLYLILYTTCDIWDCLTSRIELYGHRTEYALRCTNFEISFD